MKWKWQKDLIFFILSVAQTSTPYPQMIMLSLKAPVSLATALIPKSRTKLFQFNHFNSIQTRIIWILCLNPLALLLLLRYSAAFRTNYDVNNFNTWKSIYWKSWSLALLFVPHHGHAFLYFFFKCRLRVVPHFSSGIVQRAKRERVKITPREKRLFSPCPVSPFSCGVSFKRAAFRTLYYPWGKMGAYL